MLPPSDELTTEVCDQTTLILRSLPQRIYKLSVMLYQDKQVELIQQLATKNFPEFTA